MTHLNDQVLSQPLYIPTFEQNYGITVSNEPQSMKVFGLAGTGKSSILTMMGKMFDTKGLSGLYLGFNKAIVDGAKQQFSSNVTCQTLHSIALKNVPYDLSKKTRNPRNIPKDLAKDYNLLMECISYSDTFMKEVNSRSHTTYNEMVSKSIKKRVLGKHKMQIINDAIRRFCQSDDTQIEFKHFVMPDWIEQNDFEVLITTLLPIVHKRWTDLISPNNRYNISPDIYLKYWALTNPTIIDYDYIMVDDMQNLNKLMSRILLNQSIPIICVGDKNQDINSFSGVENVLSEFNIPSYDLTKSFRFGREIANHANYILALLGETKRLTGNDDVESRVYLQHPRFQEVDAILCCSNKGAFSEFIYQSKQHPQRQFALKVDTQEIRHWLEAAKAIRNGEKAYHPDFAFFKNWQEVIEYSNLNKSDNDFTCTLNLLKDFDYDFDYFFQLLNDINEDLESADCVITTVHKSKEHEWDRVMVSDDFNLQLMTDKFMGIENKGGVRRFKERQPKIYLENWDLVDFPSSTFLAPASGNRIESQIDDSIHLDSSLYKQRYRLTDMMDYDLRLVYIAMTRAKKELYIQSLAELIILIGKLANDCDE